MSSGGEWVVSPPHYCWTHDSPPVLLSDLEELLHQLGVGWDDITHSNDRKRRSLTGSSQDEVKGHQDGRSHDTRGVSQDWAEVSCCCLQTVCRHSWCSFLFTHLSSLLPFNQVCFSANQLVDIFALNPHLPISKEHFRYICPAIIQQLLGDACESAEQRKKGSQPTAFESILKISVRLQLWKKLNQDERFSF